MIGDPFGWMRHTVFFDDFYEEIDGGLWTSLSAGTSNTIALTEGKGGWMRLAVSGTNDQYCYMKGSVETEALVSGKKAWFGCRLTDRLTTVAQNEWRVGLAENTETNPITTTPTSHATFRCDDGNAEIDFSIVKAGVGTGTTNIGTAVLATWQTLDCYFDGVDQFRLYVDSVHKATLTLAAFPTAAMAPMICMKAGDAANCVVDVDYIYSISEK